MLLLKGGKVYVGESASDFKEELNDSNTWCAFGCASGVGSHCFDKVVAPPPNGNMDPSFSVPPAINMTVQVPGGCAPILLGKH